MKEKIYVWIRFGKMPELSSQRQGVFASLPKPMGAEKGCGNAIPSYAASTTRAGAHFRNASHLAAASLFLFVFVFTALRRLRLFRALCGTLARKEKMCIQIRIDGSICQASRRDK